MWHEPAPTVCHIDLLDYINKLIWNRKMFYNTFRNNWNLITPPQNKRLGTIDQCPVFTVQINAREIFKYIEQTFEQIVNNCGYI